MNVEIKKGDKVKWVRSLECRPLAVVDLEYVTVASWGEVSPLACTLKEVAGVFPIAFFDRTATQAQPATQPVDVEGLPGWHSFQSVMAPRDGTWFIACTNGRQVRVVHFADDHDRLPISHDGEAWSDLPTHWKPLSDASTKALAAGSSGVDREGLSPTELFDMGYAWQQALRGQTLEDSRAVGRTLGADLFEPIKVEIEWAEKEIGFNPFQSADLGICQAKRIIKAAILRTITEALAAGSSGVDVQAIEFVRTVSEYHQTGGPIPAAWKPQADAILRALSTAAPGGKCPHCHGEGDIDHGDHPCMLCGGSGKAPTDRTPTPSDMTEDWKLVFGEATPGILIGSASEVRTIRAALTNAGRGLVVEECAAVVDKHARLWSDEDVLGAFGRVATAIRALKDRK